MDVFLSYAWEDNRCTAGRSELGLISELYQSLQAYLTRCGQAQYPVFQPRVFMDSQILQRGDNLPAEIVDNLDRVSVFLACLSSHFFQSRWCPEELQRFSGRPGILDSLKIIKLHLGSFDTSQANAVEVLHNELLRFDLFREVSGATIPYHFGDPEQWAIFQKQMSQLGRDVFLALLAARTAEGSNSRPKLYVPTPVGESVRVKLIREEKIKVLAEKFAVQRVLSGGTNGARYSLHFLEASNAEEAFKQAQASKLAGLEPIAWFVEAGIAPRMGTFPVFPQLNWSDVLEFLEEMPPAEELANEGNTLAVHFQREDEPTFCRLENWLQGRIEILPGAPTASKRLVVLSHPQHSDWAQALVDQYQSCGIYLRGGARQNPLLVAHYCNQQKVTTIKEKTPDSCPEKLWDFIGLAKPA